MWGREEKLVRLYEELDTLYVFDRIHDYGADVRNRGDDNAYASRQERRSEILAEIAKRKPWFEGFGARMLKHCHFTNNPSWYKRLWLLKNSRFQKSGQIWGIENV